MDASRQAIKAGRIEGLSLKEDEHMDFVPWSWPGKPLGPYSEITGVTGYKLGQTNDSSSYVFYLGKSKERKEWEVFSAMAWDGTKWKPVAVKLSENGKP